MPIENAKFHNDKLAFGVRDNAGQFVAFRLSLTGATLNGESRVGLQTSKATLRRGGAGSVVWSAQDGSSGIYRVGGGVSAPVILHVEVSPDRHAVNPRVVRSLGLGLDAGRGRARCAGN